MSSPSSWHERVEKILATQDDAERRIAISGYGKGLDQDLWPIIARFWALGLLTGGSCSGHSFESFTFVNLRRTHDVASNIRRRHLVDAFLTPARAPGVIFGANVMGFESRYPTTTPEDHPDFVRRRALALGLWVEKLDHVGQLCTKQEAPWDSWEGPCSHVPPTVDLRRMTKPFLNFFHDQSSATRSIVRTGVKTWPIEVPSMTDGQVQVLWDRFWGEWLRLAS